MLKKLYNKIMFLSGHPMAERWLFAVSFIESSVFPIPPDIMLVPMCIEKRDKALYYAGLCTIASVLGGIVGYVIGMFFWANIGDPLIAFYGLQEEFALFQTEFLEYGVWLVFIFGLTFFPYKVITIASGVVMLDPISFVLASLASRGLRFYIEAALLWKFGEKIRGFVEKRLALAVSLGVLLLALMVIGYKLYTGAQQ